MKRFLITGGAGFVGRHFVAEVLKAGHEVVCVDNLVRGSGAINPNEGWPLFEPRDFEHFVWRNQDCREFFKENEYDYFDYALHLAAVVGGRLTIENFPLAVSEDLSIDAEFWKWTTKSRPSKVVNFSSSAAYPINLQSSTSQPTLLREEMIDFSSVIGVPDFTYGWAKLTSEYLAKVAWEKYGIDNVTYRPFSGYGVDQHDSYPFPSICRRAIEGRNASKFEVWGSGFQSRDFIHIDDCVRGVLTTMDILQHGEALNLSTGRLTTFFEFARIANNLLGNDPEIVGDLSKPQGVASRGGDTTKQLKLGFSAAMQIEQGIEQCINFFLEKH
jgi:GDP-L-fucose synthase